MRTENFCRENMTIMAISETRRLTMNGVFSCVLSRQSTCLPPIPYSNGCRDIWKYHKRSLFNLLESEIKSSSTVLRLFRCMHGLKAWLGHPGQSVHHADYGDVVRVQAFNSLTKRKTGNWVSFGKSPWHTGFF